MRNTSAKCYIDFALCSAYRVNNGYRPGN